VISQEAAWLSAFVALLVVYLTQRSASRIAAVNRMWDRRADLYMEVVRWLDQDVEALRAREPYRSQAMSKEVTLGLHALGSDALDRRLGGYRRARKRAVADLEDVRRVTLLGVRMRVVHLQIRAELGSPLGVLDRSAFWLAGSPLLTQALATVFALIFGRRFGEEPMFVPTTVDAP
jgi:hypothetical protein